MNGDLHDNQLLDGRKRQVLSKLCRASLNQRKLSGFAVVRSLLKRKYILNQLKLIMIKHLKSK